MAAPVNLLEIIEVIGEAAALKLVERFGGTTARLPAIKNINDDHPLAQCIGVLLLTKLVLNIGNAKGHGQAGGGRWLYIAKCARSLRESRNREIVTLYCPPNNVPVVELARRYHLSDRQIWNILGSTVVDDRQVSLF